MTSGLPHRAAAAPLSPPRASIAGAPVPSHTGASAKLPPGVFVTGTDTGAGKTVVAAALCAALRAAGRRVAAVKPVLTGLEDAHEQAWPLDHELLAAAAGGDPDRVAPLRFGPPMSPHLAAELAGVEIDRGALLNDIAAAADGADTAVVEGVGGLLVPIAPGLSVRDLAADLGLPLIIAARPGLGTINHTLLTIEAARAAGLEIAMIVLTPWPASPSTIERSNRETIAGLSGVPVTTLERVAAPEPELLARAGAHLTSCLA